MARLEMKATDLGELYVLLKMYRMVYGEVPEWLIGNVENHFKTTYKVTSGDIGALSMTNPRGAGRKSNVDPEEKERIIRLRRGGRTIREVASETGYSIGYVHKLIHEHDGCNES